MMATAGPPSTFGFLPLLETLEDSTAGQSEQTDAYLTIANRLSGEEGRQFLPTIEKHFSRLGTAVLGHVTSPNAELSQAALQALGFCVYHSHVISGVSEVFASHMLSALCSLVTKSTDKNTCTRALWVISKQSFPPDIVGKKVPTILMALQSVLTREEILTAVIEHEALNVIVKMLEQVPIQMGNKALHWVRLVVPLVVHPASKVRLRAAAALEMGMPLLMAKQTEVAAIIEPMMSSILIAELQKLFKSKNEMNVLKLWPLFVKLLGKLLHRGGPFINSLLHLEELGFRSSSPTVKKIAFIAWKSLIDNFALNPDILCSSKRMKLLMQPLLSIHVRTEALLLTKVEVWWYLVVQLGPNLSSNFDQVSVPLFQSTIGLDSSSVAQNGAVAPNTPKSAGSSSFNSSVNTPRMNLNSSMQVPTGFPSIQLLGLEMLLHYFLGPEVVAAAAKNNITLSLEPLNHPLLSGASSFMKHAAVLISNIRDGFINIGKEAPESLLAVIWTNLVRFVNLTIESGSKKDRQGCEVLTLMLQALQSIVASEVLSADKVLVLFEATVKGLPQRVLGSASYQVGKMDVLNGTPSLFIILLLFNSCSLPAYADNEKFFHCLQTLVACGLRGPTSPLAFAEAVLGAISNSAGSLQNKEQLWRMWSLIVSPLTDHITQSNEVNQGDALEHNFSAMHSALMFPVTHLLPGTPLQQPTQKSMLSSWTRLYKVFARCSSLVVTAEENICCEELCTKMMAAVDREALAVPSTLNAVTNILHVIVECVDFSPYTPYFQQKMKSPHTPVNWTRKRSKTLGNLSTFHSLLVQCLQIYLQAPEASSEATGSALVSILSNLFANLVLPNAVQEALNLLIQPLTLFYKQAASDTPTFASHLLEKLEKLLGKVLGCMQTCSTLAYNEELLALLSPLLCVLFPHKNKNLRMLVTQFWNATFANSVSLTYPEEIRPILSQVKQRTPIILPGFEVVSVPDELSGTYSSESSQMETKLSGMPVSSAGKRDSLLDRVTEPKNKSSTKSVSTKLDFGSPKIPHRKILEEEASVDFVFIPPETKERVLTEHQKEVKRTKRVDIPAMYNNLDASLDTTVFTQYTQSQEDSLDKVPAQEHGSASVEVIQIDEEMDEVAEVLTKENQDYSSPKPDEKMTKNTPQEEVVPDPADVSMEDHKTGGERVEDVDMECKDKTSPNTSASSDLVSGTPQKPSSRRQSFITLEKYDEGKSASPSGVSSTTGLLVKSSNSQDLANTTKTLSSESPQSFTGLKAPGSAQTEKCSPQCPEGESPRRPKDSRTTPEPVRLIERLPRRLAEDDDVIPDTQTEGQESSVVAGETKSSSQEEESEQMLDDSQSSLTQMSPDEVRRSGRHRVRPQLPGEDPKEREAKYTQFKRRRSGEDLQSESPKTTQTKPNTRSKQVAEEDNRRDGLRSRSQGSLCESSQTNSRGKSRKMIRLFSNSEDFLNYSERKRRSIGELESSQTDSRSETLSGHEGQMQKRRGRPSKTSKKADDETEKSKEESSQALIEDFVELTDKQNGRPKTDSQTVVFSPQTDSKPQEIDSEEKTDNREKQEEESKAASPQGEDHIQEKIGLQVVVPSPTNESQDQTTNKLESEEIIKDKCTTVKSAEENFSQDDSQVTPSSADSLSKRRSRRSKASSEAAESEDKGDGMSVRWLRSSQGSASVSHSDGETGGRTRRRKGSESSAGSTPDRSQSLKSSKLESSQSRGRYSRLRSSPASAASFESSESESSEVQEISPVPIKRGRRPRASLPSPLTLESKEQKCDTNKANASQETDIQSSEAKANIEELSEAPVTSNLEELTNKESPVTTETQDALTMKTVTIEKMETDHTKQSSESPDNTQSKSKTDGDSSFSLEIERLDPVGLSKTQTQESGLPAEDALVPPGEKLMAADPSEKKAEEVAPDNLIEDLDSDHQEGPIVSGEEPVQGGHSQSQVEQVHVIEEEEQSASNHLSETCAEKDIPPQEDNKNSQTKLMEDEQEKNATSTEHLDAALPDCNISGSLEAPVQDSPVKQTVLEAGPGSDIGQSPNSERARGTWSPSASPSTSILKKGQKRPLEVEVTSPLVKCRRVSFANPIQHQETADDIDRRSPAVRTSSPRRSKVGNVPPLKHITTPTKGAVIMSPRNLHSPGYRSSKKCLISEMSQEPRAVPRDCICPALVGCSAPVEAVLPQISSTMWSRGFGQLVRARNIKTVGDLSALTPTEIKTLPIRSPKISNVKKALKIYEQQRKGRGGDELKSFDETEMMTSELEETNAPQNPDEKTSGETLATELVDEPFPGEVDATAPQTPSSPDGDQRAEEALRPAGLLSAVGLLDRRMSLPELGVCSPQQLVEMHEQLGGMMRRVVIELQTRLSHAEDEQ